MHEVALMKRIIESIRESARERGIPVEGSAKVRAVNVTLGILDIHSEESFRQAFEALKKESFLASAVLNLTVLPARIRCSACGYDGPCNDEAIDAHDPSPVAKCPSCKKINPVSGGRGIESVDFIVETED